MKDQGVVVFTHIDSILTKAMGEEGANKLELETYIKLTHEALVKIGYEAQYTSTKKPVRDINDYVYFVEEIQVVLKKINP